jgi:hypothetical protein
VWVEKNPGLFGAGIRFIFLGSTHLSDLCKRRPATFVKKVEVKIKTVKRLVCQHGIFVFRGGCSHPTLQMYDKNH